MSILRKAMGAAAFATLLVAASASQAAAAVITLSPSTATVGLNQAFSVDVIVSGLTAKAADSVAGFDFTLAFNGALAAGTGFTADPGQKMGAAASIDTTGTGFTGGYTTFSTWMVESERLGEVGDVVSLLRNLWLSMLSGFGIAAAGFYVGQAIT